MALKRSIRIIRLATLAPLREAKLAAVGTGLTTARQDHAHPRSWWTPEDHGLLAWPFDPSLASGVQALTPAGTIQGTTLHLPVAASVTNVVTQVTTAGSGLTSGQCFAAIFQAGVLLGTTADQATSWASTGIKTMALAGGPFAVPAGDVDVVVFYNGTTGPTLPRGNNIALINVGLAATASRYFTADTGRTTTMPGTLGTKAAATASWWLGLS